MGGYSDKIIQDIISYKIVSRNAKNYTSIYIMSECLNFPTHHSKQFSPNCLKSACTVMPRYNAPRYNADRL